MEKFFKIKFETSMKNVFFKIAIIFIFSANIFSNAFAKATPKDVIWNELRIRFAGEYYFVEKIEYFLEAENMELINQTLAPSQSLRFGDKTRNETYAGRRAKILAAEEPLLRTYRVRYSKNISPQKYAASLKMKYPEIEIAEPIYRDKLHWTPNDSLVAEQTPSLRRIKAMEAWNYEKGDTNVVIGISDVGTLQTHEDLYNSIAPNYGEIPGDEIDNDDNGYVDDFMGYNFSWREDNSNGGQTYHWDDHGTKTAGIAGATVDNVLGMAGAAGKCRIFPIKAEYDDDNYISFGYESIVYAAVREFDVLNMSWGTIKPFSYLDQSIIDYAAARGVALVASAGNEGPAAQNRFAINYPAYYDGVLSVAEIDAAGKISETSSLGAPARIAAEGDEVYKTTFRGAATSDYTTREYGTSFSAPFVSGFVALIRAKYPYLDANQAIEFARQCSDDISAFNAPEYREVVPGRLNMLKGMTTDPYSIPGIRPKKFIYSNENGDVADRFNTGETIRFKIDAKNYLGGADNVRFALSTAYDPTGSIEISSNFVDYGTLEPGADLTIEEFIFKITKENENMVLFRVDVSADGGYEDFFLIPLTPTTNVTTFSNNMIEFSVSDVGTFGFFGDETNKLGVGFVLKGFGNQLYHGDGIYWSSAGMMLVENNDKTVSSFEMFGDETEFTSVKPFVNPDRNIGIITDEDSFASIGVHVEQEYIVPNGDYSVAKVNVKITNVSGADLNDFAAGYYFEWDVAPDLDNNSTRLFPEGVPDDLAGDAAAAQIVKYAGDDVDEDYPVYGSLVYSARAGAKAQAAAFDYSTTSVFPESEKIRALNSGTSVQFSDPGDVSYVIGMKFPGIFPKGETREFTMCFGAGFGETDLAAKLKACSDSNYNDVEEISGVGGKFEVKISPNPARDFANIEVKGVYGECEVRVVDVLGNIVQKRAIYGEGTISLNLSGLSAGVYYLCASAQNETRFISFAIAK